MNASTIRYNRAELWNVVDDCGIVAVQGIVPGEIVIRADIRYLPLDLPD